MPPVFSVSTSNLNISPSFAPGSLSRIFGISDVASHRLYYDCQHDTTCAFRTLGCDCTQPFLRRKPLFRTSAHSGTVTTSVYGDFEVYRILWDRYQYSSPTGTKATGPYPYPRSPWRGSRNAFVKLHLKSDPKRNNEPRA